MGQELFDRFSEARDVFARVEDATGLPVAKICFEYDEETLRQTQNAQIALFTCGLAAWGVVAAHISTRPGAYAGHSVGEYAAVVASGALSLEDGARLVQRRGDLMARSGQLRPGTMAAVLGGTFELVQEVCAACSTDTSVVVVANDNCPGQLVISGDVDAVQRATAGLTERGVKRILPLSVSGAFHSPLMVESSEAMYEALAAAEWKPMTALVYSNVTTEPISDSSQFPTLLRDQLRSSVRWRESVVRMVEDGLKTHVECGSGEVLCGLLRRISPESKGLKAVDAVTCEQTIEGLKEEAHV